VRYVNLTFLTPLIAVVVMAGSAAVAGEPAGKPPSTDKLLLGERIYREGLLPNGEPLMAFVKGDIPVPGTAFTCVSCHLRAGIGSVEGGVYTPPTNGRTLYSPLKKIHKGVEVKFGEDPFRRPAYTDETLVELLRYGVDPAGKVLDEVMPRYLLEDEDAAALVSYLKNLSSEFSPGVSDREIRFATVYSEDAAAVDREAMVSGIEKFLLDKNALANSYRNTRTQRDRMMARAMSVSRELETRKLTLARWVLKGSPDTWRTQLEEYNRREPVFALLGGLVTGDWEPVHRFSEENRIPCIFPNTDYPVISESDWYTMYISKGYHQEGESVARYLSSRNDLLQRGVTLQVVRDSLTGRTLSTAFEKNWQQLGFEKPATVYLRKGEALTAELLTREFARVAPDAVMIWDDGTALAPLQSMAAAMKNPPALFLSAGYLGADTFRIPEAIRDITYLAYPYRLPQDKVIEPMMGGEIRFEVDDNKIARQTYALAQLLSMAVMEIKGNYYRDNLLDVIGMSMDRVVPLYERLSFGPGQRYASKGCYVVQLGKGNKPELTRKSEWVIH